ncbi:hypothetical protein E2542_SST07316 [Spatholobus suberectus]|nr:hypothetical protein E2542_SST07316 [Spatholobus suberectus]
MQPVSTNLLVRYMRSSCVGANSGVRLQCRHDFGFNASSHCYGRFLRAASENRGWQSRHHNIFRRRKRVSQASDEWPRWRGFDAV